LAHDLLVAHSIYSKGDAIDVHASDSTDRSNAGRLRETKEPVIRQKKQRLPEIEQVKTGFAVWTGEIG
jgi:hypothetical protein